MHVRLPSAPSVVVGVKAMSLLTWVVVWKACRDAVGVPLIAGGGGGGFAINVGAVSSNGSSINTVINVSNSIAERNAAESWMFNNNTKRVCTMLAQFVSACFLLLP
jgi:hypothetical protein